MLNDKGYAFIKVVTVMGEWSKQFACCVQTFHVAASSLTTFD